MVGDNSAPVMITANEICEVLGCKTTYAYKVIKELNAELKAMNKLIVRGKTNRKFFFSKVNVEV